MRRLILVVRALGVTLLLGWGALTPALVAGMLYPHRRDPLSRQPARPSDD